MTKEQIFEKVKMLLVEQAFFPVDVEEIELRDSLANDLGFDSIDEVALVIVLEKEFEIRIVDAEADQWQTVDDICTYIETILRNKQS